MHDPDRREVRSRTRKSPSGGFPGGLLAAAAAPLLLAGCGSGEQAPSGPASKIAETPAVQTAPGLPTVDATGSATSGPDLSIYLGKHPLDKVGDHAFFDDPVVVAGVAAAVTDPAAAAAIAAMKGPTTPVKRVDGEIAASRCELNNCAAHNYAVHVDAATSRVSAVCYYDEKAGPIATWYRPDGTKTGEGGGCMIG